MSRRNSMPQGQKTSGGAATGGSASAGMREEVERLIQRERFKDAFKQAKLCFRKEESPDNHRLLERTYLLRITELIQGGMPTAAAEVAGTLLEFGVTDPSVLADLVLVLPRVGMADKAAALMTRLDSPQTQATLALKIADRAVLQPEQTPESMPELRAGGLQVRAALAALDANDEALATERLQDIPRSSPFADWRYFVRGLAAFRRGETEQAQANWDRLDGERAAHKIAKILRNSTAGDSGSFANRSGTDQSLLEMQAFGEPVLSRLEQLQTALAEDNWKEAVRLIGPLRLGLHRVAPRLAERLTEVLLGPLIAKAGSLGYEAAQRLVRDFTKAAQPPALDPRWNRLWALLWEGPKGDLEGLSKYWQAYIRDIDTLETPAADQRRRMQALVWKHLAEEYAASSSPAPPTPVFFGEPADDFEDEALRQKAIEFIDRSLQLDPSHRATHELLLRLHDGWKQPDEEAAAARRMLKVFPDDAEALDVLIYYHNGRDEPEAELPYIERLRAIKPLDDEVAWKERMTRMALARHCALAGRWEEGRAQFARVESLFPDSKTNFQYLARRCAFETKAELADRAEAFLAAALEQVAEPVELWLFLSIEARRYNLSAARKKQFDDPFRAQLDKKVRSEVAGGLANVLGPFVGGGAAYPGREWHIEEAARYLRRATRIKYREADLEAVCHFLEFVPAESALLEKLTQRGLKNFPKSPAFLFFSSGIEMKKGPFACNYKKLRKQLHAALALLESNPEPRFEGMAEDIKRKLVQLDDVAESSPFFGRLPNFGGGKSGLPAGFAEMMAAMLDAGQDLEPDFEPSDFAPQDFGQFDDTPAGAFAGLPGGKRNPKKKK